MGSAEGQASWSAQGCGEASQRDEVPGREGNWVRESRWRAGHTFMQEGQERQQAALRGHAQAISQGWRSSSRLDIDVKAETSCPHLYASMPPATDMPSTLPLETLPCF